MMVGSFVLFILHCVLKWQKDDDDADDNADDAVTELA